MQLDRANPALSANTFTRRRALGLFALALGAPLAGCGLKGPLYHPDAGTTDDRNKRKSQPKSS